MKKYNPKFLGYFDQSNKLSKYDLSSANIGDRFIVGEDKYVIIDKTEASISIISMSNIDVIQMHNNKEIMSFENSDICKNYIPEFTESLKSLIDGDISVSLLSKKDIDNLPYFTDIIYNYKDYLGNSVYRYDCAFVGNTFWLRDHDKDGFKFVNHLYQYQSVTDPTIYGGFRPLVTLRR